MAAPTTAQPLNFQGDYLPASGTQTFVTITAVPEPAKLALLAASASPRSPAAASSRWHLARGIWGVPASYSRFE